MSTAFVAVLMGSDSDWPVMEAAVSVLDELGIAREVKITSAHRTPDATHAYVKAAEARGCKVFIAAAGMAAHLAGVVAAYTHRPVLGVPMESAALRGLDALLSTVQMPGGVPVATLAIGKAGAKNAAYLAGQILAVADDQVAQRLLEQRQAMRTEVEAKDKKLQSQLR
ncbi:MAG: 5-(carboxyamino)imidazole ribonucleotide mutase [Pseudomonadota bacterium]|nr:5-(carboxyamino)imidazole ribonucleotide mutase [Pseudomonadota bacterium]